MSEDLLGYLLGALEPHEMEQVEAALRESPELRDELARIKQSLEPLEAVQPRQFQVPGDLIARTMDLLDQSDAEDGSVPPSPVSRSNAFRWSDVFAMAIAATVLIGLALPSVLHSRYEARKQACQDNLRLAGVAMTSYAMRDPQQQLPALAAEGPEAFAGVYSIRLSEAGLLDSLQSLWCPSLDLPAWLHREIPSVAELHSAAPADLTRLQRESGGSYGYTLGVMEGAQYRSPRYAGRATFAVLGDVPIGGFSADSPAGEAAGPGHGSRGVNLLFEDGHVRFLPIRDTLQTPDHPFLNRRGDVEAGVDLDDATLAPSWRAPFIDVRQQ